MSNADKEARRLAKINGRNERRKIAAEARAQQKIELAKRGTTPLAENVEAVAGVVTDALQDATVGAAGKIIKKIIGQ